MSGTEKIRGKPEVSGETPKKEESRHAETTSSKPRHFHGSLGPKRKQSKELTCLLHAELNERERNGKQLKTAHDVKHTSVFHYTNIADRYTKDTY